MFRLFKYLLIICFVIFNCIRPVNTIEKEKEQEFDNDRLKEIQDTCWNNKLDEVTQTKYYLEALGFYCQDSNKTFDTIKIYNHVSYYFVNDINCQRLLITCDLIKTYITINGFIVDSILDTIKDRKSKPFLLDRRKLAAAHSVTVPIKTPGIGCLPEIGILPVIDLEYIILKYSSHEIVDTFINRNAQISSNVYLHENLDYEKQLVKFTLTPKYIGFSVDCFLISDYVEYDSIRNEYLK